jgi:hypothetical protein
MYRALGTVGLVLTASGCTQKTVAPPALAGVGSVYAETSGDGIVMLGVVEGASDPVTGIFNLVQVSRSVAASNWLTQTVDSSGIAPAIADGITESLASTGAAGAHAPSADTVLRVDVRRWSVDIFDVESDPMLTMWVTATIEVDGTPTLRKRVVCEEPYRLPPHLADVPVTKALRAVDPEALTADLVAASHACGATVVEKLAKATPR